MPRGGPLRVYREEGLRTVEAPSNAIREIVAVLFAARPLPLQDLTHGRELILPRVLTGDAVSSFNWSVCPHIRRLAGDGMIIYRYYVTNLRNALAHHVPAGPIAKLRISEIKRSDMLHFRDRLAEKTGTPARFRGRRMF